MSVFEVPNSVFLADCGVQVASEYWNDTIGILDMPTEEVLGNMVLSVDYKLTFETTSMPKLDSGMNLQVDGRSYVVRSVRMVGDGAFSEAILSKLILSGPG
jgi:hypothetical protein